MKSRDNSRSRGTQQKANDSFQKISESSDEQRDKPSEQSVKAPTQAVVLTEVKIMTQGDPFGELALQKPNAKRQATIICTEECYFAVLTRKNYKNTLLKAQNDALDSQINFLKSTPLFAKWSIAMLKATSHSMTL